MLAQVELGKLGNYLTCAEMHCPDYPVTDGETCDVRGPRDAGPREGPAGAQISSNFDVLALIILPATYSHEK